MGNVCVIMFVTVFYNRSEKLEATQIFVNKRFDN